jgi:hypothetical protein
MMLALSTYRGFGQVEDEYPPSEILEERIVGATLAAEEAAYQAHINAALAQQASEFNKSIVVGFIGAGVVAVLMWGIAQAIKGGNR